MSATVGPLTLVGGQSTVVDIPNGPWAAVVLANLSTMAVEVSQGAAPWWLAPGQTNRVLLESTSAPIVCTPSGATTGTITATFYDPAEAAQTGSGWPSGSGIVNVAEGTLNISGPVTVENVAQTSLASSGFVAELVHDNPQTTVPWTFGPLTLPAFMEAVQLEWDGSSGNGVLIAAVANDSGYLWTSLALPVSSGGSAQWLFPAPAAANSQLIGGVAVLLGAVTGAAQGAYCSAMAGVGLPPLRADARVAGPGTFALPIPVNATSGTVVAAPAAVPFGPFGTLYPRIMVRSVVPPLGVQGTGNLVGSLTGTSQGGAVTLASWGWDTVPGGGAPVTDWASGRLLDPATAVTFTHSVTPAAGAIPGTVFYDLVF